MIGDVTHLEVLSLRKLQPQDSSFLSSGLAYGTGLRANTWYCPPSGNFIRKDSTGRITLKDRGKKNRKSVRKISNPPRRRSLAASGGLILTASRSNSHLYITYRVPGFHGLFSHSPKTPPGRKHRYVYRTASSRSATGM